MRSGGGKAKGSSFERDVCKQLSLWVTGGKSKDVFWRSAMSGGRATVAARRGVKVRQAGDICAVAPEGHALTERYFIECKHVKDLGLDDFLLKGTGTLAKFWEKACRQAAAHKLAPMLIARQNLMPTIVLVDTALPPVSRPDLFKMREVVLRTQSSFAVFFHFDEMLKHKYKPSGVALEEWKKAS